MPGKTYILFCLAILLMPAMSMAGQHALLVGVSDYTDPRIPDLEGPVNDVQALRNALIKNWQFDASDITVLIDEQATEAAILDAIDSLHDITSAGDDIIIYYSGHGTSSADPDLGARLNLPDGSGAIVGSDFDTHKLNRQLFTAPADDGLIVGRFEIRPRLQALDADRNMLVIFDACFSGNATREVASAYKPVRKRQLDLSEYFQAAKETNSDNAETGKLSKQKTRSLANDTEEVFNYQNTVYFGAAAENQFAVDISMAEIDAGLVTTIDGKPHGGFTDSLLRALSTLPESSDSMSFVQLFNRTINQFNTWCKACGHTPVSLPTAGTLQNDLMGRTILTPSVFLANNTGYDSSSEPALQEALVLDALPPEGIQLALRKLGSETNHGQSQSEESRKASPDLYFTENANQISAFGSDGQLISQMPADLSEESMAQWIAGQQWLKKRTLRDLNNEQGRLQVSFRQPMASNRVNEGTFIHFNVLSEMQANLVVLALNSRSELSLLYPVNAKELDTLLPAFQALRIPEENEPSLQVTPPWGTDTVLFYTLPPAHSLKPALRKLASMTTIPVTHPELLSLERALDNELDYSAMTIRVVATPNP